MKPIEKKISSNGNKSRGKSKNSKNRKTRAELNEEARKLKKLKNRKGNPAGSRFHEEKKSAQQKGGKTSADPRLGSKVKVDLSQYANLQESTPRSLDGIDVSNQSNELDVKTKIALNKELVKLESSVKLERYLELLDAGESLTDKELTFVDETLGRISELYEILGIEVDPEEDTEEQINPSDDLLDAKLDNDLLRILKS
ncbi:Der GTPase-activating protein YihI [Thorsellia anophelis]|uniref:Der GTPase-activating protein YihI n=1 Tax=Thorsellia anophelis DSM 18579 TaxID=1123402 RepID=A0A1H9Y7X3_9GAMM|nr:Der GTPase-activating protein YihI [Thorsellia anophelis]SES64878.1 hypothetical protein SAMN02583745_00105 [Thorsellia anophelis DSM 18579]